LKKQLIRIQFLEFLSAIQVSLTLWKAAARGQACARGVVVIARRSCDEAMSISELQAMRVQLNAGSQRLM
jgi:hypothetical protein